MALILDDSADVAQVVAALVAQGYRVAAPTPDARLPAPTSLDVQIASDFLRREQPSVSTFEVANYEIRETPTEALRLVVPSPQVNPVTLIRLKGVPAPATPPMRIIAEREDWRSVLERDNRFGHLVGRSKSMQHVYRQLARVAPTSVTVFIHGEAGTGKELVARTVHDFSRRCKEPFLAVNCGAFSPQLIESEIFGHEKGSFTGAERHHEGYFERADGGTLFLDELSEMPLELQVKLLRVLESGTFMRVGSTQLRQADVRIIAATNRDPRQAASAGQLREDLMYRLNVFPIFMPPLRDRLDDVPLLADHILHLIGQREGWFKHLNDSARVQLERCEWPGNVRELRNVLDRAYVMAEDDTITSDWLPRSAGAVISAAEPEPAPVGKSKDIPAGPLEIEDEHLSIPPGTPLAAVTQRLIELTLRHFNQNKEKTAAALGVNAKTLYNKLKSYETRKKKS